MVYMTDKENSKHLTSPVLLRYERVSASLSCLPKRRVRVVHPWSRVPSFHRLPPMPLRVWWEWAWNAIPCREVHPPAQLCGNRYE
jgi:hypothetical protein